MGDVVVEGVRYRPPYERWEHVGLRDSAAGSSAAAALAAQALGLVGFTFELPYNVI